MTTKTRKPRTHNEWFRTVSLGNRKSCPNCKAKLEAGESIWSWGEYLYAKWRTIKHFCKNCFPEIKEQLNGHTETCGCSVELQVRELVTPGWLKL